MKFNKKEIQMKNPNKKRKTSILLVTAVFVIIILSFCLIGCAKPNNSATVNNQSMVDQRGNESQEYTTQGNESHEKNPIQGNTPQEEVTSPESITPIQAFEKVAGSIPDYCYLVDGIGLTVFVGATTIDGEDSEPWATVKAVNALLGFPSFVDEIILNTNPTQTSIALINNNCYIEIEWYYDSNNKLRVIYFWLN